MINRFALTILALWPFLAFSQGSNSIPISNISWDSNPNPHEDNFNVLLARPTANSISIDLISLFPGSIEVSIDCWSIAKIFKVSSPSQTVSQYTPTIYEIQNLQSNTNYSYQIHYYANGIENYSPEYYFSTAKEPGFSFSFAVEADPHFDDSTDLGVYVKTLNNVLNQKPDFMISLGDFLMSDMLSAMAYDNVKNRSILMRQYYDYISRNVPLMYVLGNHEAEFNRGKKNNFSTMSTDIRRQFLPNPEANTFYSGNSDGSQNYYAFEWGNALFVGLDCFRYSKTFKEWEMTLGETQYKWFKSTLESSNATFKFVFSHNLIGGPSENRGGIENAKYFEWGGYDSDGVTYSFDKMRPGWGKPIHQIMIDTGVSVWFHGHDHLYAHQMLDGITYQEVPQPGRASLGRNWEGYAHKYNYYNGTILSDGGFISVSVSSQQVEVQFITYEGKIGESYSILPKNI